MSDTAFGATVAKRKLARRLKQLREANGYTANQVCDKLDWGRGKVGRFEGNGWVRPEMSDVRDLLRLYEKSDQEGQELEQLAVLARERPWWRAYADVFDNEFPGYENDATRIRTFVPLAVPGLLQTRAFVRAYVSGGEAQTPEWREKVVEARMKRQEVLEREESTPELVAVVTEAALMYQWGSAAERREQILHLVDLAQRPNVDLRMLRFEDGAPAGTSGTVNIFDFPADEPTIVFAETEFTVREVTDEALADAHIASFESIHERAAAPGATIAQLRKLAKQLE